MAKRDRNQLKKHPVRKGEGIPVHVALGPVSTLRGLPARGFGVDLSSMPVPERKYSADICAVVAWQGSIKLMFGQPQIGSTRLRSCVIVAMNEAHVATFLSSLQQMQDPTLAQMREANGWKPSISPPISEEPIQVVQLTATMALVALSESEVCLDFFEASAFSMQSALRSETLYVDPVVRVTLHPWVFIGAVEEMTRIVADSRAGAQE